MDLDAVKLDAVSPPGWEKWTESHKGHGGIDNPFALAWYLHDQGAEPSEVDAVANGGDCPFCKTAVKDFKKSPEYHTYLDRFRAGKGDEIDAAFPPPKKDKEKKLPIGARKAQDSGANPEEEQDDSSNEEGVDEVEFPEEEGGDQPSGDGADSGEEGEEEAAPPPSTPGQPAGDQPSGQEQQTQPGDPQQQQQKMPPPDAWWTGIDPVTGYPRMFPHYPSFARLGGPGGMTRGPGATPGEVASDGPAQNFPWTQETLVDLQQSALLQVGMYPNEFREVKGDFAKACAENWSQMLQQMPEWSSKSGANQTQEGYSEWVHASGARLRLEFLEGSGAFRLTAMASGNQAVQPGNSRIISSADLAAIEAEVARQLNS